MIHRISQGLPTLHRPANGFHVRTQIALGRGKDVIVELRIHLFAIHHAERLGFWFGLSRHIPGLRTDYLNKGQTVEHSRDERQTDSWVFRPRPDGAG